MAGARVSDHALKHPVNQLIQRPPFSRPNNRSRDPRGPGRRAAPLSERLRLRFALRVAEVFMDGSSGHRQLSGDGSCERAVSHQFDHELARRERGVQLDTLGWTGVAVLHRSGDALDQIRRGLDGCKQVHSRRRENCWCRARTTSRKWSWPERSGELVKILALQNLGRERCDQRLPRRPPASLPPERDLCMLKTGTVRGYVVAEVERIEQQGRRQLCLRSACRVRTSRSECKRASSTSGVTTVRHASSTRSSHGVEQHGRIQSCAISRARMPPAWFMSTRPESSVVLQVPHIPS